MEERRAHLGAERDAARLRHLVYAAFFLSGASGLALEIVWLRMLKLVFGATALATSTVLTAFMAGLALGSYWLGRVADRSTNKLRLYALLELGVGASALLLPTLFELAIPLYAHTHRWQAESGSPYLGSLVYFAICFALLLLPTTLMGGTLPVLSAYLIRRRTTLGKRVGMLYGLNTLGAMTGCFAAGFVCIRYLGETGTLRLAGGAYMAIGLSFLVWSWRSGRLEERTEEGEATQSAKDGGGRPWSSVRGVEAIVLVGFGLSGMASLGYEVAWTRMLVFFISLDTYAFSAMLTVFLMGIGLGSYLYTRLGDGDGDLIRRFAWLEAGIGVAATASLLAFSQMRRLNAALMSWEAVRTTWVGLVAVKFADATVAILLPTLMMGATFPLVSRIVTSLRHKGRSIGNLYCVNTIGAIAGAFLAGFVLVPTLGVQPTVIALGGVNFAVALALWQVSRERTRPVEVAVGLGLISAWVAVWGIGWQTPIIEWTEGLHEEGKGYRVLYSKDGIAASISILERDDGNREVNLDGKSTAFTNYSDIQVHQYLGHLPMMLYPSREPPRVLVVGFGLGSTSWSCLQHPVAAVECAELVQEERETARYFAEYNHGVLSDSSFVWIAGDGRNHLLSTRRRYGVITVNAIHPRYSPSLYTSDFYQLVRDRLTDEGVVCAWMTLHALTDESFKMLLRSFLEVFPEATLWDVNSQHLVVIGSKTPLRIDYALWSERLASRKAGAHLREVHLEDPLGILSHFMLDARAMEEYCSGVPLNSDDRPYVEFGRGISASPKASIFNELMGKRRSVLPLLDNLPHDLAARSQLYEEVVRSYHAMAYALPGRYFLSVTRDGTRGRPLMERALTVWPESEGIAHALGKCWHVIESERAAPFQKSWAQGWQYERAGQWPEAVQAYRQSVDENPRFAKAYQSLALACERAGMYPEAVEAVQQLVGLDPRDEYERWLVALEIQMDLQAGVEPQVTMALDGPAAGLGRASVPTALFIARAYNAVGGALRAAEILRAASALNPGSAELFEAMGLNALDLGRFIEGGRYLEEALRLDPGREPAATELERARAYVARQIQAG
ncbi:fused MFS/spermidine synthase [Candidatus Latescibacterota bacterium]